MEAFISILFLCLIAGLGFLNRFGKNQPGKLWKNLSTFSLALFLFLMLAMIVAIFNQKLPLMGGIFGILFYVLIWFIGYWIAGVFLRKRKKIKPDENSKNLSNEDIKKEKKKNMTCGKRFGLYILYLLRDWAIYIILSAITQGFGMWRYNTYSDAHFSFDMFVCFIIFIIETIRVISDCSKIKKGTYGK